MNKALHYIESMVNSLEAGRKKLISAELLRDAFATEEDALRYFSGSGLRYIPPSIRMDGLAVVMRPHTEQLHSDS